jgi:hypothetical protein
VQQGIHRLERGQYYFNTSQTTAQSMAVSFNWEKHELPNVGHEAQLMANDALQYFLPNFLSVDTFEEDQQIKIYPNPTQTGSVTFYSLNNQAITVHIFDVLGKHVKSETLTNNTLNVSNLKSGIYIAKITQNNISVTKKLVIK